jgi:hypothetical protein
MTPVPNAAARVCLNCGSLTAVATANYIQPVIQETAEGILWDLVDALDVSMHFQTLVPKIEKHLFGSATSDDLPLVAARERLESFGRRIAFRHPPDEWMWLLRRMPPKLYAVLGPHPMVANTACRIAEALTNPGTSWRPTPIEPEPLYDATPTNVRDLLDLVFAVRLLTQVSAQLEIHNRSHPLAKSPVDLGWSDPTAEIEDVLRLYQTRQSVGDNNPLSATGAFAAISIEKVITEGGDIASPVLAASTDRWAPVRMGGVEHLPAGEYLMRFVLVGMRQEGRLHDLVRTSRPSRARDEACALLALLIGLSSTTESDLDVVLQRGYRILSLGYLQEAVRNGLKEIGPLQEGAAPSVLAALELLSQLSPTLWPLRPGTALRPWGPGAMVDVVGATRALLDRVGDTTRADQQVNAWSTAFEEDLQSAIDGSAWKPRPDWRKLRGRDLRHQGRVITDVDAIAARDGVLLLVSAKAWSRSPGLDMGDFVEARRFMRKAEEALDNWERNAAFFGSCDVSVGQVTRPGSGGQSRPRVSMASAMSACGE